jgi:hypothetical protein
MTLSRMPATTTLFLAILLLPLRAAPGDGRDFAGFYGVSNVTDLGAEVRVTLTLRIHNYSSSDVADAAFTLEDSLLPDTSYGSITNVPIAHRRSVGLSGDFTITRYEYDLWAYGAMPQLRITYTDASGSIVRRTIELAPMPPAEGE